MDAISTYRRHCVRRHLAESTVARYDTDLRAFQRWLGEQPITDATAEQVQTFLDSRRIDADRTRYRWLSELHRFYTWAVVHEHATHDPTLVIDRPRLARLLPRPIPDHEMRRALACAGPRMRCWLLLTYYAGLRCIEIARLDRAGLTATTIRVVGKGRKERVVPVHEILNGALADLNLARTGPVFRNRDGRPFSAKEISRRINTFYEGIGLDVTAHQGRHSFGTRAYRASRNLRAVQELMGHADATTTASYAAVTVDDLAEVIDAIPAIA